MIAVLFPNGFCSPTDKLLTDIFCKFIDSGSTKSGINSPKASGRTWNIIKPPFYNTILAIFAKRQLPSNHSILITNKFIPMPQNGKATTIKKTFSRATSVQIDIKAETSTIWKLLTNAADFPRWNSTVLSIEGKIKKGEKIKLKSYLDPNRTFKIKIKEMLPEQKMVWGDMMGTRTFTLTKQTNGVVQFRMHEKIGGPFFPLFASKIPSFDESFERYAADLKKEAESN